MDTPDLRKLAKADGLIAPLSGPRRLIEQTAHYLVLALSLALIVFISYDTFAGIPFLGNKTYMTFQLIVCIFFLADFFLELSFAPDKKRYIRRQWFFFLIAIPYLNIIALFHIRFSETALYFIRFIPLVRGAYSMAMVVGFFSTNKAFTLLSQYAFILLSGIYFMSLIFYYEERSVNPDVLSYWDSLYWAFLNVTTVGSSIEAMTVWGKVGTVLMAMSGMMMLPLFTVYVTDRVKRMNEQARRTELSLRQQIQSRHSPDSQSTSSKVSDTSAAPKAQARDHV